MSSAKPDTGLFIQITRRAVDLEAGDLINIKVDDCSKPSEMIENKKAWLFASIIVEVIDVKRRDDYCVTITVKFGEKEYEFLCVNEDTFILINELEPTE